MIPLRTDEHITEETLSTDQILSWSEDKQQILREELNQLFLAAFPQMPETRRENEIEDFFRQPTPHQLRHFILFRDATHDLIATIIFDDGEIEYKQIPLQGMYAIHGVVVPAYQKRGLGQTMVSQVILKWQPDVFFATCSQSGSLHLFTGLHKKQSLPGFEVYPRLEQKKSSKQLITVPYTDLDFAIRTFTQTYQGVVGGNQKLIDHAVSHLTVFMVRKNLYGMMYDFEAWERGTRPDRLAKALGVTNGDGVLVMIRKIAHKENLTHEMNDEQQS